MVPYLNLITRASRHPPAYCFEQGIEVATGGIRHRVVHCHFYVHCTNNARAIYSRSIISVRMQGIAESHNARGIQVALTIEINRIFDPSICNSPRTSVKTDAQASRARGEFGQCGTIKLRGTWCCRRLKILLRQTQREHLQQCES